MRRISIEELQPGLAVNKQAFLLRDKSLTATRSGSSLLRVMLGDRSGSIPGIMFDAPTRLFQDLVIGKGVEVTGRVEEYRDALQIRLDRILAIELPDVAEFLPSSRRPIGEMQQQLDALIDSVQQTDLNRLLLALLGPGARDRIAFREAPAAKRMHHASRGGLLEHTLSVVSLVEAACAAHPELDRDLALSIAILHDLGKIRAYDPTTLISPTRVPSGATCTSAHRRSRLRLVSWRGLILSCASNLSTAFWRITAHWCMARPWCP